MKLYDQATQDLAQAVQHVLEGKAPVKEMEMKYPHDMFDPKTGKKEVAKDEAEHKALAAKGYTHEAPKENVAGPADLSVDQNVKKVQAKHGAVKKIDLTAEENETLHDEALAIHEARQLKDPKTEVLVVKNGKVEVINKKDVKKFMAKGYELAEEEDMDEAEMSAKQAAYRKVFDAAMKKFGVKSPAELEDGKKKEFFDYIDANYEAEGEVKEGVEDKIQKAITAANTKIDQIRNDISSTEDAYNDNDIDKAEFKKLDKAHNKVLSKAEADLDKLYDKLKKAQGK